MTKAEFYNKYMSYARKAAAALGELPEEILARWDWETGTGTNRGTKELNNLAGVNYSQYAPAGVTKDPNTAYAKYPNLDLFVIDYVRVMRLSYYKEILEANKTPDLRDDIEAHNRSPYSKDDYDVNTILKSISTYLGMSGQPSTNVLNGSSDTLVLPALKTANLSQAETAQLVLVVGSILGLIALAKTK